MCLWMVFRVPQPSRDLRSTRGHVINNLIITDPGAISLRNPGVRGKWYVEVSILVSRGTQCYWIGYCFLSHHFYFSSRLPILLKFYMKWILRYNVLSPLSDLKAQQPVLFDIGLCQEFKKLVLERCEIIWCWKRKHILCLSFV